MVTAKDCFKVETLQSMKAENFKVIKAKMKENKIYDKKMGKSVLNLDLKRHKMTTAGILNYEVMTNGVAYSGHMAKPPKLNNEITTN